MRAAVYARVSTTDQNCDNQLLELRSYVQARVWTASEYVDKGISGARESRPALDQLLRDARRRRFDVLIVWRLDRLGRSLKHLIMLLDDFAVLGIGFVSLHETIDTTTAAGRLSMQVIAAVAEYERAIIRDRVRAGIARAKANGVRLGRPRKHRQPTAGTVREAAKSWGVSKSTAARWIVAGKVGQTS